MGFSKDSGAGAQPTGGSPDEHHNGPNFGQRLQQYATQRSPIAGALLDQVFGQPQMQQQQHSMIQPNQLAPLPGGTPQEHDMTGMNAMPRQGGGLSALLKLLA